MGFPLLGSKSGWLIHGWFMAKHQVEGSKFGSLSTSGAGQGSFKQKRKEQVDITLDQASLGHFSWVQCSGSLPNPSWLNQEYFGIWRNSLHARYIIHQPLVVSFLSGLNIFDQPPHNCNTIKNDGDK